MTAEPTPGAAATPERRDFIRENALSVANLDV